MRKIITGFFFIMLSVIASQAVYGEPVGKFTRVEGRVDITRPGNPAEEVKVGSDIFEKDIVRSKSSSKAEILFTDGNILKLAQNTRLEISEYINASGRRSTVLNLFRGKIQNRVKKLLGSVFGNEGNRYEVHTPTAVCGVRGTDFFMYYERGESGATFKEGFGYGYNKNDPDNIIGVDAGQSMIIPDADAPPVVQTVSDDDIERLEGETTPVEEDADEEESDAEKDIESEAAGDDSGAAGEDEAEEGAAEEPEGKNEGDSGSVSNSTDETQKGDDSSSAGEETGAAGSTGDTGDIGGFTPEENLMTAIETGGRFKENISEQPVVLAQGPSPEITPPAPVEPPYIPPVETLKKEPPPVTPPPSPTALMAFTGNLMGLVYGTHYEGEYIMPRATNTDGTMNIGWMEQARYEYQYFLKNDGKTYIRGMSESKTMDSDISTIYNYAPEGKLFKEIDSKDGFSPDVTELAPWKDSLAFLADPPSSGYYKRFPMSFATTIITGTGTFTGDITGISSELWVATKNKPVNITLSGQHTSSEPLYIFKAPLSGLFDGGGAYSGYFGGNAANTTGSIYALYLSPDGTGLGILSGKFSPPANSTNSTVAWNATGTMFPELVSTTTTITGNDFLSRIGHGFFQMEKFTGTFSGSSATGIKGYGFGDTSYVRGYDWGIFNLAFGYADYKENIKSGTWAGKISGNGLFGEYQDSSQQWHKDGGIWAADITNGTWLDNGVSGDIANGRFLTMTMMGTIEGALTGPGATGGAWSAISQGIWKKTTDLSFSSSLDGGLYIVRGNTDGNRPMISNQGMYNYHYDLYSHEGGYHFYNAAAGTDTHYQVNARSFDGTYANFYSQKWVYDRTTQNFISYETTGPFTNFDLASLATPPDGFTWETGQQWTSYNMFNSGWLDGIMGGLENLWSATSADRAGITFLGNFESPFFVTTSQPLIFAKDIVSYNPYNKSNTTPDGGAYAGFIGGVFGPSTKGNIYAIYIDKSNMAGILIGNYQGNTNMASGIWEANGEIYPIQVKTVSISPGTLLGGNGLNKREHYFWGHPDISTYQYPGEGTFLGASSGNFKIGGNQFSLNIDGESWGVWQAVLGGVYSGTPNSRWIMDYHSEIYTEGAGNSTVMIVKNKVEGTWSGNSIEGKILGAWVDLNDIAPTVGVSSGKLTGTYDPSDSENMTWQSVGTGVWVKAGRFLEIVATDSGRATLSSLNIPAVEIGKTTLSGTGSTVEVTMHDVTFFKSSTGTAPELWATGNVEGTFTANPLGQSVPLTDGAMYADFNIKAWNTANNTWGADISNGNGTLNRTDTGLSEQITFSGVAGGTHTGGTTSGAFTGEGAGYASEQ
jgi:hypothetical protein